MVVTREEVKHLGWLAKLEMSDAELQRYTAQIEEIINYLNMLDTIPLEQVKPIAMKKKFSELRKDAPENFENAVLGTRYRKDGFVKGPRMV
ncbi:MAG: Asp-tRNA(Asn)/Glu-tRNA(Gln) amidotransferase subunit GatC [Thermoproteota archaeon]|jgi:aspartyl-tRNA(Asn)/glutamyl-tRNA(Gln) amidotransferase subunit C|nr:Asp-tRNA(Asn)/Glu-tRNA(Gln) amidotransferase subunit GatC [Thermoproteota archaeon]MDQ4017956.1 Asp-tRNA(Asn)/Glu-tRNA(Gln) amidotransferase subunit GatC [Thermoproteota archaeon]